MTQPVQRMTRFQWAFHMVSGHTVLPGTPSLEEMMLYPQAWLNMKRDHDTLHQRFHTGHEHDAVTGAPIAPPKPKPFITIVDD